MSTPDTGNPTGAPTDALFALARAILFEMDPERAHDLTLNMLARDPVRRWVAKRYATQGSGIDCMGLRFANRVGLAAGLDKNGDYIDALGALGFGCIEIGTVTPKSQPGNAQPRLFRLPAHGALINRMGFNNLGVEHLVKQVQARDYKGRLGINIGKNASTPLDQAEADYTYCLERVYALADYVTINVSSPNTQGLRDLQHGDRLRTLLGNLKNLQTRLATQHGKSTPLLVKMAPDMSDDELDAFCDAIIACEIDGVICGNTTRERSPVARHVYAREDGGLSGAPLLPLANSRLARVGTRLAGKCTVIGVGGIHCGQHAADKLALGADLVQLYSGLIYHGPALVGDCIRSTS